MKKNVNLTEVNGTYAKCLADNLDTINNKYNAKCPVTELKSVVSEIIAPASNTPAKKGFIANLEKTKSADQVLLLVYNSYARAMHMGANINDRWANEQ